MTGLSARIAEPSELPLELRVLPQWVGWRLVEVPGRPKPTKQPLNPRTGALASTTDSSTWGTFEQAARCPESDGVGFVFTEGDPYAGVDLDDCRDPQTGAVEEWAAGIVRDFDTYTEVSPSGTGLHLLVRAELVGTRRRKGRVEMYDRARYFTMTGQRLPGTPPAIQDRADEIAALYAEVFGPAEAVQPRAIQSSLTDVELLDRARQAANGEKLQRLWAGETTGYESTSEADLALCSLLAFWAGPDQSRIDRLFRQSALMRPKWDEPHGSQTYGEMTIATALSGRTDFVGSAEPADAPNLNQFMETDAGNAEAFAASYQGQLVFDHRLRRWLIRGEHRWVPDNVTEVRLYAKRVARGRLKAAAEISEEEKRKRAVRHAVTSESRQRLDAMIELAKSEQGIADTGEDWDARPDLLAATNGVVELDTGRVRSGRAEDRITLAVPIPYRADAACPRWERFLEEVFAGDREVIAFIQRAVGYSLTGHIEEHALFLLFGTGRNGKSVLLNTLRRLFGDYALNLPFSAFELGPRSQLSPDLALLPGKRLVTSSETNDGSRLNEARIKALTGGDPITANPKYAAPFEFMPVGKFWLAVNHLPVVHDDSEGFWQRVMLIRFERVFKRTERDPQLEQRLAEELPGIFAWAVRGAVAWKDQGLTPPPTVRMATESYRTESDPLADFVAARCAVAASYTVQSSALYTEYSAWCDSLGMPSRERLTLTAFGRRIGERFTKQSTKRGKFYVGIGLLSPQGDGFEPGDGLGGRFQKVSHDRPREGEFGENPSQPVTQGQPVTTPLCGEGCGTAVGYEGELCGACAESAFSSGGDQ
ncbi:MAG: phage/plasmid primase, P4 family [Dehalococcoidia bacterium]